MSHHSRKVWVALVSSAVALGCGGGGGKDPGDLHTIGGKVVGLDQGTLTLRLNGANDLQIEAGATTYRFSQYIASGGVYTVEVKEKPAAYKCSVAHASAKVVGDVTDADVTCSTTAFHVGGTVYGLARPGLQLQVGATPVPLSAAGAFTFPDLIASGAGFNVTIAQQPAPQRCEVRRGSGTIGSSDVTSVVVTCGGCAPGWCWENPLPQGNRLTGVWGSGSDDVWAVGVLGTILHWNGEDWSLSYSPTTTDLQAVWGSGASDAWAVGAAGALLHWDGGVWAPVTQSVTTNTLRGVWGSAADDVWAVGDAKTVIHWDGTAWSDRSPPAGVSTSPGSGSTSTDLQSVWGASKDDVWVVGGGCVLRWNGSSWIAADLTALAYVYSGSTLKVGDLSAVWGSGPADVYLAGSGVTLIRWDGAAFGYPNGSPHPDSPAGFTAVWGTKPVNGAGEVWGVGWGMNNSYALHGAQGVWTTPNTQGNPLTALWGAAANDVWAVGFGGELLHWNGTAWTSFTVGPHASLKSTNIKTVRSLSGSSADDVWASTSLPHSLMHRKGSWEEEAAACGPVWVSSASEVWSIWKGGSAYAHWSGGAWTSVAMATTSKSKNAFWGSAPKDVWAVGAFGSVDHWDGTTWTTATAGSVTLNAIWGSGASNVWAVGESGAIQYWNGSWNDRTNAALTTSPLYGVWGSGASDVWAVGAGGTVIHYNGGGWAPATSPANVGLTGIWGGGANDVWVVGTGGTIFHRADGNWAPVSSGTVNDLYAVWGSGAGDIRVGGNYGTILTWKP